MTAFVLKALLLIVVCCAIGIVLFGLMVWPIDERPPEETNGDEF